MDPEPNHPLEQVAWNAEIEQRIAELDRGEAKPIPWSEAQRMIFGGTDRDA
jgi:Putative addiction module component